MVVKIADLGLAFSSNFVKDLRSKDFRQQHAPELYEGTPFSEELDVWSIGVMLYLMVFGKWPTFRFETSSNTSNELIETLKLIFQNYLNRPDTTYLLKYSPLLLEHEKKKMLSQSVFDGTHQSDSSSSSY